MSLPRVESFLFCMSLKTGGFAIGWITIFISLVFFVTLSFMIATIAMHLREFGSTFGIALLIIVNFYAVFTLLLIISAGIMMRGILKCNPYRLIPFMICLVLGVILGFIQIIRTGWDGVTPAIAWGFWNFYLFVCMLSLYRSLEQERKDMNKFKRRDLTTSRS